MSTVDLRYSDDGANNWISWDSRDKGRVGSFLKKLIWQRLGFAEDERTWEIRDASSTASAIMSAQVMVGDWQEMPLPDGSYSDANRPWSSQDVVNLIPTFAEGSGTRSRAKFVPVPGLRNFALVGDGPHRGSHSVEGRLFVVSGETLYQVSSTGFATTRGTIPGTAQVSMTHNQIEGGNELLIGTGDSSYVYNTKTESLQQNDNVPLQSVDFLNQLCLGVDVARRFWRYSGLSDATTWNTLDNESAESSPDLILGLKVSQGEVFVFGQRTIEVWTNSPTDDTAFQRSVVIERGCASGNSIQRLDNSLFWLGDDGIVYRLNGYQPTPISSKALTTAFQACDVSRAISYTFEDNGYVIYYLTFPDGQTWGYDVTSQKWHRRQSFGLNRWRVNTLIRWNDGIYGGDYSSGNIYRLSWGYAYESCELMPRSIRTGVLHNNGNRTFIHGFRLQMDTGTAESVCLPILSFIVGTLPDTCDDADYSETLSITHGVAPYSNPQVVSGTAPAGTTLTLTDDGLLIEFSNATAGDYDFWVTLTDSTGESSPPFQCTFTVHDFQMDGTLPDSIEGDAYDETVAFSDGLAPYTLVSATGLPTGGVAAIASDELHVTWPDTVAAGVYTPTFTVEDTRGCTVVYSPTLTVTAVPVETLTWDTFSTALNQSPWDVEVSGGIIGVAANNGYFTYSTDSGATWTSQLLSGSTDNVAVKAFGGDWYVIAYGAPNYLYKASGTSFAFARTTLPFNAPKDRAIAEIAGDLYAGEGRSTVVTGATYLRKMVTVGLWTQVDTGLSVGATTCMLDLGSSACLVGTVGKKIIRSSDAMATFAVVHTMAADIKSFARIGTTIVAATSGGAWALSTDNGVTWTDHSSPQMDSVTATASNFIGVKARYFSKSADGVTWTAEYDSATGPTTPNSGSTTSGIATDGTIVAAPHQGVPCTCTVGTV